MRNLVVVFGDQLNKNSSVFTGFHKARDSVWMAEVEEEATHVWCHKQRIVLFFSAMRHYRNTLAEAGVQLHYHELTKRRSSDRGGDFAALLTKDVRKLRPERIVAVRPGDYRVLRILTETAEKLGVPLEMRPDQHFFCSVEEFRRLAEGSKRLLMESFYRTMRKQHAVLMTEAGKPLGGQWNYDKDNRETFGGAGPDKLTPPLGFKPDAVTKQVLDLVATRFRKHPGRVDRFDLPVTANNARKMLKHFVKHALPLFGTFEDAMWTGQPFLYHSRLSSSLNLKLLDPRECVDLGVKAYAGGKAPLNSVEGFVRQILGWREYIRGIYWLHMPDYAEKNFFSHEHDVPQFFWNGDTEMACVREAMQHVIDHGYTHHIERLMVLGLLAQLAGVHPRRFHEWHMGMYVDAVDWVSLPNALGMSQFGDGGIVGTKPYCATGNYINRMSNYCKSCVFSYKEAVGEKACPFTTLYWDFLDRHYKRLKDNPRLAFQIRNLEKKRQDKKLMESIRVRAGELRGHWYG